MLLKILFWLFVAIDAAGIGLLFVLGLAAAGSSKTHPLAVAATLLVVPGLLLLGAILLHERATSPLLRTIAFLAVGAPAGFLAIGRITGEFGARANPGGIHGETPLTRALRELPRDPNQLATVRSLLTSGADPNEMGEQRPLVLAVHAARHVGLEPLQLLLDHGADANAQDGFGTPAWFAATGVSADPTVLHLLLDRGADPKVVSRDGRSGAWAAVATNRWDAALLLVERGASVDGTSPMGLSLLDTLEQHVRLHGDGGGVAALLAAVRTRTKGK